MHRDSTSPPDPRPPPHSQGQSTWDPLGPRGLGRATPWTRPDPSPRPMMHACTLTLGGGGHRRGGGGHVVGQRGGAFQCMFTNEANKLCMRLLHIRLVILRIREILQLHGVRLELMLLP